MSWVRPLGQGSLYSQAQAQGQALRQKMATKELKSREGNRRPSFSTTIERVKALDFQRPLAKPLMGRGRGRGARRVRRGARRGSGRSSGPGEPLPL